MTAEECRQWRERLGALVLDQLDPSERAATEAHLEGCPECRAEVASLQPLAGLLPLADPAHLAGPAPEPPPELADRVTAQIAAERRAGRRRRRLRLGIGLAGASAATAAALVALLLITSPATRGPAEQVAFRSLPPGVSLAAELRPQTWGTEIRMHVRGIRSGTLCRVFLQRAGGARVPAGSFRYRYGGTAEEPTVLSSALDVSAARAIGVQAGSRTFLAPLPGPSARGSASAPSALGAT